MLLRRIKGFLHDFVRGVVPVDEFVPGYEKLFAPFDPPDVVGPEMSEDEQRELELFIKFMGGWFSEDEHLIPRRADWEYGKDVMPYSWIETDAYRQWISRACADANIDLSAGAKRRKK